MFLNQQKSHDCEMLKGSPFPFVESQKLAQSGKSIGTGDDRQSFDFVGQRVAFLSGVDNPKSIQAQVIHYGLDHGDHFRCIGKFEFKPYSAAVAKYQEAEFGASVYCPVINIAVGDEPQYLFHGKPFP